MSRLRPLPYRKVARALVRFGFKPTRQRGSHVFFQHADGRTTTVPMHPHEEIGRGLLRRILEQANLDPDEFLRVV
ncbi:MAG: type II toxin-antitoxin system HicA family toxin [Euryarchaeota archaeon]|nr:type II toxin-antitoxin system HicA family toxin [Euryarchaeota archaeon]